MAVLVVPCNVDHLFGLKGSLLPQQPPDAAAPSPADDLDPFGMDDLSPAEAESPLGAAAVSMVEQVGISSIIEITCNIHASLSHWSARMQQWNFEKHQPEQALELHLCA